MAYLTYRSPSHWLRRQRLDSRISVGAHTYFDRDITFALFEPGDRIEIGSYCSIARGSVFFGGGNHYFRRATTFPFQAFGASVPAGGAGEEPVGGHGDVAPSAPTSIGSDVWFGHGVRVLPGSEIGHGAVIGAGSVVSGKIPPYSIASGNPAGVLRGRFKPETVERLLEVAWWEWPTPTVIANLNLLLRSPEEWPDRLELAQAPPDQNPFPAGSPAAEIARHAIARVRETPWLARLLGRRA